MTVYEKDKIMKVILEFDTMDEGENHTYSKLMAVMEKTKSVYPYRLVYVERLSEDGRSVAKSELMLSERSMRMIRKGDIDSDFLYEKGLVHNTTYKTPYGMLPISIETSEYEMEILGDLNALDTNISMMDRHGMNGEAVAIGGFAINVRSKYTLSIQDEEPVAMDVSIKITPLEDN